MRHLSEMLFVVQQEKFEGPLELLLELVEKEELAISEISLARVAEEYLIYIKGLNGINPVELAEFLVVAAQLMLIKSRSLLPQLKLGEEEEASIQELEDRLAAYKIMRELAHEIKMLEQRGRVMVSREAYRDFSPVFYPPSKLTIGKIEAAFAAVLAALPKIEKLAQDQIKRVISLQETVTRIRSFLQHAVERSFSEIVKNSRDKVEIIVSFLALLELSRERFLDLNQERMFEDIWVKKV